MKKPTHPVARPIVAAAALLLLVAGCDNEPYDAGTVGGEQASSDGDGSNGDGSNGSDGDSGGGGGGTANDADLAAELEASATGFYDALTQAYAELDPAPIEAVSAQDCQHCRDYAASVTDVAESGQEFSETGSYELSNVEVVETPGEDGDVASVAFDRRHTGLTIVDGTGATVQESEDETVRVQLRFRNVDGQWLVLEELYLS